MSTLSLDDFILKVVLEPKKLHGSVTVADIEQLLTKDAETVTWAFTKPFEGATHAA